MCCYLFLNLEINFSWPSWTLKYVILSLNNLYFWFVMMQGGYWQACYLLPDIQIIMINCKIICRNMAIGRSRLGHFYMINCNALLSHIKDQAKSKSFFQADVSSKKQTNEFNFTLKIVNTFQIKPPLLVKCRPVASRGGGDQLTLSRQKV